MEKANATTLSMTTAYTTDDTTDNVDSGPKREKGMFPWIKKRWKNKRGDQKNEMTASPPSSPTTMSKVQPRQALPPRREQVIGTKPGVDCGLEPSASPTSATSSMSEEHQDSIGRGLIGGSPSGGPTTADPNCVVQSSNGGVHRVDEATSETSPSAIAVPTTAGDMSNLSATPAVAIVENDRRDAFHQLGNKSDRIINPMSQVTPSASATTPNLAEPPSPILRRAPSVDASNMLSNFTSQQSRMTSKRRLRNEVTLPWSSDHGPTSATASGIVPQPFERRIGRKAAMGMPTPDNDVVVNGVVCAVPPPAGGSSNYYDQFHSHNLNAQQRAVGTNVAGFENAHDPFVRPPPMNERGKSMPVLPSVWGEPSSQSHQEDQFARIEQEVTGVESELQKKINEAEETIKVIQQTIELQEDREQELEDKIRELTFRAHAKLSEGKRNPAVRDMKKVKLHKKEQGRINKVIQTMERQILSIESALNNIRVAQAVTRGSKTMEGLLSESEPVAKAPSSSKEQSSTSKSADIGDGGSTSARPPARAARRRSRNSGVPKRNNSLDLDDLFAVQEESIMSLDDALQESVQSLAGLVGGGGIKSGEGSEEEVNDGATSRSKTISFEDSIRDLDDALNSSFANLDLAGTSSAAKKSATKKESPQKDFVQEMKSILSQALTEDHSLHKSTNWEEDELLLEELQSTVLGSTANVVVLNNGSQSNHSDSSFAAADATLVQVMQILPLDASQAATTTETGDNVADGSS